MLRQDNSSDVKNSVDEAQVMLLKQGNSGTWGMVVDLYREQLRDDIIASLQRRYLSTALVDDIEQITWITAAKRIAVFEWRGATSFYHWLRVIAYNHVRRAYAQSRHQHVLSLNELQEQETFEADAVSTGETYIDSIENEVLRREQARLLQWSLSKLTAKEADMVQLWVNGEPRQAIAEKYRVSPSAVSMMISRATRKLRPYLELLK